MSSLSIYNILLTVRRLCARLKVNRIHYRSHSIRYCLPQSDTSGQQQLNVINPGQSILSFEAKLTIFRWAHDNLKMGKISSLAPTFTLQEACVSK